jgi:hypothetical protein
MAHLFVPFHSKCLEWAVISLTQLPLDSFIPQPIPEGSICTISLKGLLLTSTLASILLS